EGGIVGERIGENALVDCDRVFGEERANHEFVFGRPSLPVAIRGEPHVGQVRSVPQLTPCKAAFVDQFRAQKSSTQVIDGFDLLHLIPAELSSPNVSLSGHDGLLQFSSLNGQGWIRTTAALTRSRSTGGCLRPDSATCPRMPRAEFESARDRV